MFYLIKTAIACTIGAVLVTLLIPLTVQAQEAKPAAQAQGAATLPRIGSFTPGREVLLRSRFRQGLREVGYVEGQNITVEYRFAKGRQTCTQP